MSTSFDSMLDKYADLIVKVGLNLRPGQKLLMVDAGRNHGTPISASPLVRKVARKAYEAGAGYVDVIWSDDQLKRMRFELAPRDSFDYFPDWMPNAVLEYVSNGDALLNITGLDPDLLVGEDSNLIGLAQNTILTKLMPALEYTRRNASNWCLVSVPVPGWAAKVYPELPADESMLRLWETIFHMVRVDQPDPVAVWQSHLADLAKRTEYFEQKRYTALKYMAPGTDLFVGLPALQSWKGGRITSGNAIPFVPNLPTEEIFTLADRSRAEGRVTATKSLSYTGQIIEDFTIQFSQGKVTGFSPRKGESVLRNLFETDEGASRLGEVALVPDSSPVSRSGLLFHNALFDENAASLLAFGAAYKFTLQGGETMSDDQFKEAGGNSSIAHVDFMIGSSEMDIDAVAENGNLEPVMRSGEWAFSV